MYICFAGGEQVIRGNTPDEGRPTQEIIYNAMERTLGPTEKASKPPPLFF